MSSQKQRLLYGTLERFYQKLPQKKQQEYYEIMSGIKKSEDTLSLRLIDWFITQYAQTFNIFIRQSNGQFINIHSEYKQQLKAFSKQYFDPFRRKDRIEFKMGSFKFETTIGQLNLFKWLIETEIIDFIKQNRNAIQQHLQENHSGEVAKKRDAKKVQKKPEQKNVPKHTTINEYGFKNKISFN